MQTLFYFFWKRYQRSACFYTLICLPAGPKVYDAYTPSCLRRGLP
uniref:Uncharacterized protein n=1 Tax=Rhizophora mucronata TaxID=61149 RepID=A0A2P2IRY4_RHIMU